MDNLLNVRQAAYILKVHPLSVRRYIKDGRLKAVRAGGNVRIKESQLLEFNKDFTATPSKKQLVKNIIPAKVFNLEDPIFRLRGRGASLNLSS
jgi:excisionase family DNA binding protein